MAWNPSDKYSGVTLSNNNRTAEVTGGTIGGVRSSIGRKITDGGKYYFEIVLDAMDANEAGMVGVSSAAHPIDQWNSYLGATWNVVSMAYPHAPSGSGACYYKMANYGSDVCPTCSVGDVIGVALNFDQDRFRFYRNGVETTYHSTLDSFPMSPTVNLFPSWSPAVYSSTDKVTLRETASEMDYLPEGYLAWDGTANGVDQYTKSLLHFDSDLTDATGKTWAVQGNAAIASAQKKFGAGSLLLDGTGDYIQTSESADFNFGTDPFTIDFWLFTSNVSATSQLFMGNSNNSFMIALNNSFSGIGFGRNNVAWDGDVPHGMTNNTWNHIEFGREGTSAYIFVNGTLLETYAVGSTSYAVLGTTFIGGLGASYNFAGYIDEFRVSKGVCRHTASFTPPSAAYGSDASEESWLMTLVNGAIEGLKGTAKSAIPYYDGNKFVMKEAAGAAGKMLTLDSNGDLAWVDIPAAASAATEAAAGIAELATQAEVIAGTDASRIVTPATLQGRIGANSGIAPLDSGGKVPTANLPSMGGEVTISVPASESLATGDMVNLWTDSGTVKARKASCTISNDIVKECHGFAESAVTSGNTATVKISGTMTPTIIGGSLSPGALCYVHNETFAGYVTHSAQTTQGYYNQIVGLAITSTTMLFKPQRARIIKGV